MQLSASEAHIRFIQEELKDLDYFLESWEGYEEINQVSEHRVVIRSSRENLDLESLFLKPAAIEADCYKDKSKTETRIIKGIIRTASVVADEADQFLYSFSIVPQLWLLSQSENTRIFQKMTSKAIVQAVIGKYGIPCKMNLKTEPRVREYCVQYQESDLNFISRLAEDDGFYFFFEQDKDKVIFIDDPSSMKPCAPLSEFAWDPGEGLTQPQPEKILKFECLKQPRWKNVYVKDYNYNTPEADLVSQSQAGNGVGSSYQYWTGHTNCKEGDALARIRLEEQRAGAEGAVIGSSVRSAASGCKFKLVDFPSKAYNLEYQIIRIEHEFHATQYRNTIRCLPLKTPYRPPRVTRRPFISGLQTATVVGPSGYQATGNSAQDIYVDNLGRIKILFQWDLDTSRKEESSCWVRLMREYAGPNYGIFFLPRVGNEVLVSFFEGNPDRPIVVGSVHHANNVTPIQEPANKTQNTLLMPSTNELRFEDKEGCEQIYMHAQKDHDRVVENNESVTVKANRTKTVLGGETTIVVGNRTETVKKNETITILQNRTETVTLDETIAVQGNRTESVTQNESVTIVGTHTHHVVGAVAQAYDAIQSTTVAKDITITSIGSKIHIKAATEIQLQVGASSLLMKSDGYIRLSGVKIAMVGSDHVIVHGNKVTSKALTHHDIAGEKVSSIATSTNTVQGSEVLLNC